MNGLPLSVVILSFNAEKTIANCVDSVRSFDQILVVDSGSTDETGNILSSLPITLMQHEWLGYAKQRQMALAHCKHDWVFFLDSDEVASESLLESISGLLQDEQTAGISIPIHEHFMGKANHVLTKRCSKVRIFRRSKGCIDTPRVHEGVDVDGKVASISGAIHHYGEKDIATKLDKINHYSSLSAEDKHESGKRTSLLRLGFTFPLAFFKSYILRRQCFSGRRGFIAAMVNAFYAFLKQAKLFEYQQNEKNRVEE